MAPLLLTAVSLPGPRSGLTSLQWAGVKLMYTLFYASPPHLPLAAISSSLRGRNRDKVKVVLKKKEGKSQVAGAAIFLALCPLMARLHSQDAFVHLGPSHIDPLAQTIPFSSLLMTYVINSCSSGKLHTASFCGVVLPPTHNPFRFFGEGQSQLHFLLSTLVQTQEVYRSLPLQPCHCSLSSKPASANL